ncbi:hypothetical protein ACKFKF_11290 [Phormidesmis sp. 146-12]
MTSQWRYYPAICLGSLIGLTVPIALFIYQMSPLRNPTLVLNGTLANRLDLVTEKQWFQGATTLAMLIALNLMIMIWQHFQDYALKKRWHRMIRLLSTIACFPIWIALFNLIHQGFVMYLLNQKIV